MAFIIRFEDGNFMFHEMSCVRRPGIPDLDNRGPLALLAPSSNTFWPNGRCAPVEERVRHHWGNGSERARRNVTCQCQTLCLFETRREAENVRHALRLPERFTVEEVDPSTIPQFFTSGDRHFFSIPEVQATPVPV